MPTRTRNLLLALLLLLLMSAMAFIFWKDRERKDRNEIIDGVVSDYCDCLWRMQNKGQLKVIFVRNDNAETTIADQIIDGCPEQSRGAGAAKIDASLANELLRAIKKRESEGAAVYQCGQIATNRKVITLGGWKKVTEIRSAEGDVPR